MDDLRVNWPPAPNGFLILAVGVAYVLLLLVVAWHADRIRFAPGRNVVRGISYALSLSVLCTSWTYFGAVGLAMRSGWSFLANSLGPIVALTVLWPIWRRVAMISKRENVSSVADFIASRYGKSRPLGALIACVAIVGALPYIALQIMALNKATAIVLGTPAPPAIVPPLILIVLAVMSILFGARRPTLTQHDRGLTLVVTLEALVKVAALVTVAGLAILLLMNGAQTPHWDALGSPPALSSSFLMSTMLCTVTMFTLPRVFHMGFVTFEEMSDLKVGRWLFPAYMALWAAAIVPIAVAGATLGALDPDTVVLNLPLRRGGSAVAAFAFLGGFSAGAAMVMVETIALSAMISNELILPWLARNHWASRGGEDVGALILRVRRVAIIGILALSYLYFIRMLPNANLPRLGFASLAASAQLIPSLVGAVTWRRGHARGAIWGIVCGMLIWLLTVGAPQLGLANITPQATGADEGPGTLFNIGVCLSLTVNLAIYVGLSLSSRQRLIDRIQANAFLADDLALHGGSNRELSGTIGDLRELLQRFLGPTEAALGLADFGKSSGRHLRDDETITPAIARVAERMLAGAIGASSARNVIALALANDKSDASDVSHILDEAAHAVNFSREILHTAFNAIDQGMSVVDSDLRLVAWNEQYIALFRYPRSEVYAGKPLAELIPLGGARASMPSHEIAAASEERLGPIRRRERQLFEREWPDGTIIRVVGRPLSTGEYITTFTDVTEIRAASRALGEINEDLEQRVRTRTYELTQVNQALTEAKGQAERVTSAQNRFVAAASHDLLQPMHAARLYLETARDQLKDGEHVHQLLSQADLSIEAADRLLKALLNLSRVEIGGVVPEFMPVDLDGLLADLRREFKPLADVNGLDLHILPTGAWAHSNPDLLRSVLQNLLGNAIRYTPAGRIVVCVRPDAGQLRIEVRDSGPGIGSEARELIFREFIRLPETSGEANGAGLGLAIARRICTALDHRLAVRSEIDHGSVFSVSLPRAAARIPPVAVEKHSGALGGLRVLCIEDNPDVLQAQSILLEGWGATVIPVQSAADALGHVPSCEAIIADYHLGPGADGLELFETLQVPITHKLLLTADSSDRLRERAARAGVTVLGKPVRPASLRAFLIDAAQARASQSAADGF